MSLSKKNLQKTDELFDKACGILGFEKVDNVELIDQMQGLTILQTLMNNNDELYTKDRDERIKRIMYCMKGEFDKRGIKFKSDRKVIKDSVSSYDSNEEMKDKIQKWAKSLDLS